jgi:hypothetical protein
MKFSSELLKLIEVTCVTVLCDLSVSGHTFTRAVRVTFMKLTCNGGDVPLCGAAYYVFLKTIGLISTKFGVGGIHCGLSTTLMLILIGSL